MAAVIGDIVPDSSRFHTMIANPSLQRNHSHNSTSYRSTSKTRPSTTPRAQNRPDPLADLSSSTKTTQQAFSTPSAPAAALAGHQATHVSATGGASRFPSPPPSSSPSINNRHSNTNDESGSSMAPEMRDAVPASAHASSHTQVSGPPSGPTATNSAAALQQQLLQQPSPSSDDFQIPTPAYTLSSAATSQPPPEQTVIHIRDLAHIQLLASSELLSEDGGPAGVFNGPPLQQMKYEISDMPIGDIIEMVAALLTKITTTNDLQHDAMQRNVAHQQQANQSSDTAGSHMNPLSHSVLAFHGKNVPAITILSYLSRIHKYCPTTYEVFLSLLVYFDRMTERVNDIVTKGEGSRTEQDKVQDSPMRDDGSDMSDESDSDLADDDDDDTRERPSSNPTRSKERSTRTHEASSSPASTYFVVDSFNIHRLIISGVTCASKFFSDVFYTNSRYAKVGGLPLVELNHLELQFLLLNDFRLAVPVEDLEAYATMLVEFYAREVVAKKTSPAAS